VHDKPPMRALALAFAPYLAAAAGRVVQERAWRVPECRGGHRSRPALSPQSRTLKRPCCASLVNWAN
jgi:hypothetical protein